MILALVYRYLLFCWGGDRKETLLFCYCVFDLIYYFHLVCEMQLYV
jgi:hypothetical protein